MTDFCSRSRENPLLRWMLHGPAAPGALFSEKNAKMAENSEENVKRPTAPCYLCDFPTVLMKNDLRICSGCQKLVEAPPETVVGAIPVVEMPEEPPPAPTTADFVTGAIWVMVRDHRGYNRPRVGDLVTTEPCTGDCLMVLRPDRRHLYFHCRISDFLEYFRPWSEKTV